MESSSRCDSVRNLGPTVVFEPKDTEVIADIVFVHGLQGHPKNTWTPKSVANGGENSTKIEQKTLSGGLMGLFWPKKGSSNTSTPNPTTDHEEQLIFWPYHLLPDDCKNVRILTWGYNSNVSEFFRGSANKGNILSYSRDLLGDLTGERGSCLTRPIIFVAHSLGGIIVKAMLLRASESDGERDKDIYLSSKAILFLGTPHRGGNFTDWGETARRIVSAAGFDTNSQNIHNLAIDNPMLEDCRERFVKLHNRRPFEICTFQEGRGMKGTAFLNLNQKVVDDVSSEFTSPGKRFMIDANHMEMCRYSSKEDDGYRKVSRELRFLCEGIEKGLKEEAALKHQELNKIHRVYIDSLAFPQMNYRQEEVLDTRDTHEYSCRWILQHQNYQKWLADHHGLLWIQGNPGSGKSTLMKRIFQASRSENQVAGRIHLAFFFHRRGVQLQHTFLGMLRTMLHQLLGQVPSACADFLSLCGEKRRLQGEDSRDWEWQEPELCRILRSSLVSTAKTHSLAIFVDALDEAGEEAARSIVSYLHQVNEQLLQSKHVTSICFSCRHYPIVRTNEGIQICVEDENFEDISAFALSELRRQIQPRDEILGFDPVSELQELISEKSSGVFLWVALIIRTITKQYNDGRSFEEILEELKKAPADLTSIYKHVLGLVDPDYLRQTLHLMEWICLAEKPLSLTELRFALAMDDSSIKQDQEFARESTRFIDSDGRMKRLTISLSGGLAEVKLHDETQIVQFIHQSVNDFLLKDGFAWLDQNPAGNAIGRGHDRLTKSCVNYLRLGEVERAASSSLLEEGSLGADLPFLQYSAESWLLHAEKAELWNIPQSDLIQRFQWPTAQYFSNWIQLVGANELNYKDEDLPNETTLMHVAAASNLESIVAELVHSNTPLEATDAEGNTALHDAAYWGHKKTALILINAGANVNARTNEQWTPLERAAFGGHIEVVNLLLNNGAEVNQETGNAGSALQSAAIEGRWSTVKLLLDRGADIHAQGGEFGNALQAAAWSRSEAVVKLLLDRGAGIHAQGGVYGNALQAAAWSGSEAVVKLLLDRGAGINAQGGVFGNALQAAARSGSEAVVKLLLDRGVNINKKDSQGRLAVHFAMRGNEPNMIKYLLERGVRPDWTYADYQGLSALHFAASGGSVEVVKLILSSSINIEINLPDTQGWTPLHWACRSGDVATIQLLVNSGADLQKENMQSWTSIDVATFCGNSSVIPALSRVKGSTGSKTKRKVLAPGHKHNKWCYSCHHRIYGTRYNCVDCTRIDLCFRCIKDAAVVHDLNHTFRAIDETVA